MDPENPNSRTERAKTLAAWPAPATRKSTFSDALAIGPLSAMDNSFYIG
jgi:hypothetical protein